VLSVTLICLQIILSTLLIIDIAKRTFTQKTSQDVLESLNKGIPTEVYVTASYNSKVTGEKVWEFGRYKIVKLLVKNMGQLNLLESDPSVISIWKETVFSPPPFPSQLLSGSYNIRNDPSRAFHEIRDNWAGRGVTVGIIDTGLDYTHPDFYDSENSTIVKAFVSFIVSVGNSKQVIWIPYVNGSMESLYLFDSYCLERLGDAAFLDINGHGTHVAGIIAGQGKINPKYRGIAYGARLVIIKAFNKKGEASTELLLDVLHYVYEHVSDYGIDVLNLSWGAPLSGDGTDPISIACSEISDAGIYVVAAAGNYGNFPATICSPAVSDKVIAVGAWDAYNNRVASFSSLGDPTAMLLPEGKVKPDFLASGVMVVSTLSRYANLTNPKVGSQYVALSGTSMSTAVASGLVSDWLEYYEYYYGKKPEKTIVLNGIKQRAMRINWFFKDFLSGYGVMKAP
jgi:subtilisin family serine protease